MKIDLLTLVLALLFVIGLLGIDSVTATETATQTGFFTELPFNADTEKS